MCVFHWDTSLYVQQMCAFSEMSTAFVCCCVFVESCCSLLQGAVPLALLHLPGSLLHLPGSPAPPQPQPTNLPQANFSNQCSYSPDKELISPGLCTCHSPLKRKGERV